MNVTIRLWYLLVLCFLLFLVKLVWYPAMSYLWVFSPLWLPYGVFFSLWLTVLMVAILLTPFGLAKWTFKPTPRIPLQKMHSARKKDSSSFADLHLKL